MVESHPLLGRVVTLVTPKPTVSAPSQSTQAWAEGAAGEEFLGRCLATLPEPAVVLNDRRIPGTKANIDHIVVTQSGVFVIDAKNYSGRVEGHDVGPWHRVDMRLFVNGRDRTRLVDGVERQVSTVQAIVPDSAPVRGVLCFVGENWPVFLRRPLTIRGVVVLWPSKLLEELSAHGSLSIDHMAEIAKRLSIELPAA